MKFCVGWDELPRWFPLPILLEMSGKREKVWEKESFRKGALKMEKKGV